MPKYTIYTDTSTQRLYIENVYIETKNQYPSKNETGRWSWENGLNITLNAP